MLNSNNSLNLANSIAEKLIEQAQQKTTLSSDLLKARDNLSSALESMEKSSPTFMFDGFSEIQAKIKAVGNKSAENTNDREHREIVFDWYDKETRDEQLSQGNTAPALQTSANAVAGAGNLAYNKNFDDTRALVDNWYEGNVPADIVQLMCRPIINTAPLPDKEEDNTTGTGFGGFGGGGTTNGGNFGGGGGTSGGGGGRKHLWVTENELQGVFSEAGHHQADSFATEIYKDLNKILQDTGAIPNKQQMQYFLAVCMHESRTALTEAGYLSEAAVREYCKRYEPNTYAGKNLGNTQTGDGYKFRGAGYIQLTGRENYQKFSNYIEETYGYDSKIMSEGADHVAKAYAWEAAVWFWMTNDINGVIALGNDNEQDAIELLRQVSNAVFRGNANSTSNPNAWDERQARYDDVVNAYPGYSDQ